MGIWGVIWVQYQPQINCLKLLRVATNPYNDVLHVVIMAAVNVCR